MVPLPLWNVWCNEALLVTSKLKDAYRGTRKSWITRGKTTTCVSTWQNPFLFHNCKHRHTDTTQLVSRWTVNGLLCVQLKFSTSLITFE